MRVRGWALLSWPLLYRPMHDALIDEAFDKAEGELDAPSRAPYRRRRRVRFLCALALMMGRIRPHAPAG